MKRLIFSAALALTAIVNLHAIPTENRLTLIQGSYSPGSQGDPQTEGYVNALPAFSDLECDLVLIAKWTGGNWSSLASGVTGANFSVNTSGGQGNAIADITWNLVGTGFGLYSVMGSQSSAINFYEVLSGKEMMGMGQINAPGNGNGWSHISFFGANCDAPPPSGPPNTPPSSVPDSGSTLALLGAGVLALAGFRSRKK
ncbi:VPDSG-CTERM sorting domain-containing protein [Pelagicoccus sp. SDUM812002]|uniref:VPDSG-CTERM sorting domain-containing protein n=1 Tax=Pelagicoccus sp. SDUM812002 TaxID=3041266 RepID=UPI0028107238|nr:VPDSG-CTERM sorting domain-containing protein [Pelagicoccus sp. SDUM812002]MDQ8185409.1 VPDSG-CTERM sorting domain-containing protein [Pelagicoccus sp. SDUM812002]